MGSADVVFLNDVKRALEEALYMGTSFDRGELTISVHDNDYPVTMNHETGIIYIHLGEDEQPLRFRLSVL